MSARPGPGRGHPLLVADVVSVITALVVLGPALAPGQVLLRDMVFVPHPALSPRLLGLTGETPRAVPSDLVVALAGQVLPGGWVQKLVLVGTLVAVGMGTARLVPSGAAARATTAVASIWNPFVAERLAMGHWALLVGYAACPWVVRLLAHRLAHGGRWIGLWVALVLGSLGGASAQLLVGLCVTGVLVTGLWTRWRHRWAVVGRGGLPVLLFLACGVVWLAPSLLGPGIASDPRGFDVFAARADLRGGLLASVVTGGGIWNADAAAPGRGSAVVMVASLTLLAVSLGAWILALIGRSGPRWSEEEALARGGLLLAGAAGLTLTLLVLIPGVVQVLSGMPGGGLLRDSTRQLGPWVILVAVGLGWAAHSARRLPVVPNAAPLLPVVTLPLVAWGQMGVLSAVTLPPSFDSVVRAVEHEAAGHAGQPVAVVLPWSPNRSYPWNGGRTSLTPWSRLLGTPVVESSDLTVVDGVRSITVRGEDRYAAEVGRVLNGQAEVGQLRRLGVSFVIVDSASAQAPSGSEPVLVTSDVSLHRIPGVANERTLPSAAARGWILLADGAGLLLVLLLGALALTPRGQEDSEAEIQHR